MADPIEVITATQLMSYPGAGSPTAEAAEVWAFLANGLVSEVWANPVSPPPFWVVTIALEAAARAARNPKGLQSWTRGVADASRTERVSEAAASRVGVYLDDADIARLRGDKAIKRNRRRFGTIRIQPGT